MCAQWDLTAEQLRYHNGRAAGQHLVIRVYRGGLSGERIAELHVHPESRHWFIHVDWPGTAYSVELGYYTMAGQWHQVAVSEPVFTPSEASLRQQEPVKFATFRPEIAVPSQVEAKTFPSSAQPIFAGGSVRHEISPAHGIAPQTPDVPAARQTAEAEPALQQTLQGNFSAPLAERPAPDQRAPYLTRRIAAPALVTPTPAQAQILRELTGLVIEHKQWLNSAEITELHAVERERAIFSVEAAQPELEAAVNISSPVGLAPGEITSQAGRPLAPGKSFWFNVNAELIIYGATEPDAHVSIGGRAIKLRPDGTFSYRFALPDGAYSLPITATAAHGDQRRAELGFYRGTRYTGVVGEHPQDPALKRPAAENIT